MSSYLAVSPLPTTVETVAGGLLSVALFPDLAIGGRYPPSYPAESGLSSKERLATLSPRPSVRLLFFSFSKRKTRKNAARRARRFRLYLNYNLERVLFNVARPIFSIFSPPPRRFLSQTRRLRKRRKTNKKRRSNKMRKVEKTEKNERARSNAFVFLSSFRKSGAAVKRVPVDSTVQIAATVLVAKATRTVKPRLPFRRPLSCRTGRPACTEPEPERFRPGRRSRRSRVRRRRKRTERRRRKPV